MSEELNRDCHAVASSHFLPTASLNALRTRARLLAGTRAFFDRRGYWEVETPLLSHDGVIDANLTSFVTYDGGVECESGRPLYLQTSPEFGMKRLLVAGATAIYQLGHVFRRGERGQYHNPEFTMLEWYLVGSTSQEQMQIVEELVVEVLAAGAGANVQETGVAALCGVETPFARTTYREAFVRHAGVDVFMLSNAALKQLAQSRGVSAPESLSVEDRDGWLNLLLAELVEPRLGQDRPEFLCDYPASQSALARIRPGEFPVAERFELYVRGIELCNGYQELTDTEELRRRIERESARRVAAGEPEIPVSSRLLEAMEAGLPECSGVALGFDRLAMLALNVDTIDGVIAFPVERA